MEVPHKPNVPALIQYLTYINPLRYFLKISRGVFLQELTFEYLMHLFWPMALIGLVTMMAATRLFCRRLQ